MPAPLRAFISSTMDDLGNERRAVAARLRELHIEPVNAEELPPDGRPSWSLIENEIKSCQLFILLLGEHYGWIPDKGRGAGEGRSVTHMEALTAREHNLIILPFLKRLRAKTTNNADTTARDKFRKEIENWESGYFRQTFDWADDLARRVGEAVSSVLAQALLREFQAKTAQASVQQGRSEHVQMSDLHTTLASASWISTTAVLLAGAGMSIAAGYPTAASLTELLVREMGIDASGPDVLFRHGFADVADIFEDQFGRQALLDRVVSAFSHPGAFGPTAAHMSAVRLFRVIVTSNFDQLFEAACGAQGIPFEVVTPALPSELKPTDLCRLIFKIDGSIGQPDSLVLSKNDVSAAANSAHFWNAVSKMLEGNPLIVVGHALRDSPSKRIPQASVHVGGAYVSPFLSSAESILLKQYGLTGVRADADSFMIAYEQARASRR